jgi:glycosyltransferase involved in cell wall biosynthesis
MGLEKAQSNEYFLSVGTIEPRKNYSFGLSAWRDFVTESNFVGNLIIVGRPGWKTHDTQKELRRAINEQVIWMSNCCDGALEKLYAGTQALISFSLAEGFDLPPMEARQRYQKSLILSDIPVHREFHEDYAVFFSNKLELIELLKNPRRSTEISKYFEHSVSNLNLVTSYLKSML